MMRQIEWDASVTHYGYEDMGSLSMCVGVCVCVCFFVCLCVCVCVCVCVQDGQCQIGRASCGESV